MVGVGKGEKERGGRGMEEGGMVGLGRGAGAGGREEVGVEGGLVVVAIVGEVEEADLGRVGERVGIAVGSGG